MQQGEVSLEGLDKAEVFAALYNAARPQGMGFYQYEPAPMTVDNARTHLSRYTEFDYVKGRVMKINLSRDDFFRSNLYNRDNGENAAERVVQSLQDTKDVNNSVIRSIHHEGTGTAADHANVAMNTELSSHTQGRMHEVQLGLSDVADILRPHVERARKDTGN